MSFSKRCNRCENIIFLSTGNNGKWHAFDDSALSMIHSCSGTKTSNSQTDRVSVLEKIVRHLYDKTQVQSERLEELENLIKRLEK